MTFQKILEENRNKNIPFTDLKQARDPDNLIISNNY